MSMRRILKIAKATPKIPKSRSKYLMQFLQRKAEERPEINLANWDNIVSISPPVIGMAHRRGNSGKISPHNDYSNDWDMLNNFESTGKE